MLETKILTIFMEYILLKYCIHHYEIQVGLVCETHLNNGGRARGRATGQPDLAQELQIRRAPILACPILAASSQMCIEWFSI